MQNLIEPGGLKIFLNFVERYRYNNLIYEYTYQILHSLKYSDLLMNI